MYTRTPNTIVTASVLILTGGVSHRIVGIPTATRVARRPAIRFTHREKLPAIHPISQGGPPR